MIVKERLKPAHYEVGCKTPVLKQHREGESSPITEPTASLSMHSDTT